MIKTVDKSLITCVLMMAARLILVCSLLIMLPLLSDAIPVFLRRRWTGRDRTVLSNINTSDGAPARWHDQKLDHSDSNNQRAWPQRYWMNDTHWDKHSGPVFLFIGGEGEEDNKFLQFGEMMDLAQRYKGLAIILEHRFYGMSRPTKDMSLDNLKYLSSRQALADMAQFRSLIANSYNMTDANRWIAYGGSYAGALAAWVRIKYPDLFYAAVATSAPVLAEYDFKEYLEVVGQSLLTTVKGKECVEAISVSMGQVDNLIANYNNWTSLSDMFNLEYPLSSMEDCKLLASTLAGLFMGVVQYNNDSRSNMSYDMNDLCYLMTNSSLGEPLDRLMYKANHSGVAYTSNFKEYLKLILNETWFELGERQWFYQTCTEFGYFQTSDSKNQPFGSYIDIDLYSIMCEKVFKISAKQVQDNIDRTNKFYGGKDIPKKVTRIVFPNGSVDPWHALGITKDISDDLKAVYINGTAHCANMYPANKYDRPELTKARAEISTIVGEWLSQKA